MSVEKVRAYLTPYGVADRMRELEVSSATVELAALALGVEGARIAKTLSFKVGEEPNLIVAAGDAKVDNSKYKHFYGTKAKIFQFISLFLIFAVDSAEPLPYTIDTNCQRVYRAPT